MVHTAAARRTMGLHAGSPLHDVAARQHTGTPDSLPRRFEDEEAEEVPAAPLRPVIARDHGERHEVGPVRAHGVELHPVARSAARVRAASVLLNTDGGGPRTIDETRGEPPMRVN